MALVPNEDQQLLQRTAQDFVRTRSSLKRIRALRDSGDALGFSRDLWREMAVLGWAGIPIPEAYGGAGLGQVELAIIMEELGRGLAPEPMLSTVCLGANAIVHGGTDEQKREILPGVASGETLLSVAWEEAKNRIDPISVDVRAKRCGCH